MSPHSRKRSQEQVSEQEDEATAESPASKRRAVENDENVENGRNSAPANASPPPKDSTTTQDENEDGHQQPLTSQQGEELEQEDGEQQASQQGEEQAVAVENNARAQLSSPLREVNRPGKPAEAGVILQVYVENFMCHTKLRVDLCRNVNFIHGQNGSGKSAILAAIQICLGAGARRTHRARNLKELVRKEASPGASAKIRVTLLNRGDDGYEHDTYGDKITVERTISLKGGFNGYKLLDENLVEKSRNKKDLDAMLDTLNIQVENPVAVLDQEEAKKFLTGKAEEKYAFFLKATELERIDRVYCSTIDSVEELTAVRDRLAGGMEQLWDNVKHLKQKYDQYKALENLQEKVVDLQGKYAWSVFNVVNGEYETAVQKMDHFREKAAKKEEELTQAEEAASGPGDEGERRTQRVRELTDEAVAQAEHKRQLEAELKQVAAPLKAQERELKNLKREKNKAAGKLSAAKQRLQKARDEMIAKAGSAEAEAAQRTARLQEAESQLEERRGKVNELKQAVADFHRSYEELEPHVHDARADVSRLERQMSGVKNTIRELEKSGNNSIAIFGQRVAKVHHMVEKAKQQRQFKGPVLGPIGSYLKIAPGKEDYASLAESAIGAGTLDRFIVTNADDRRTLQNIRMKAGCQQDCGIFQVHESPRFQIPDPPVDGIETVASVLSIDNDIVFNCLVDNAKIDQRALARDKKFSEEKLLIKDQNGRYAIRGIIKEVFFMPRGDQWTIRKGSIAVFSNERKFRQTICSDSSAAIEAAKRDAEQVKAELKEARTREGKLQGEHTQFQRQWNQARRAMRDNDTSISDLGEQIEQIRTEMDVAVGDTGIDTTEYEEDVRQCEQDISILEETEAKYEAELSDRRPELDAKRKELDENTMRNDKIIADLRVAEEEMAQFLNTQTQQKDAIEKKREKLAKYKDLMAKHEENVAQREAEQADALLKARKLEYRIAKRREQQQEPEEGDEPSSSQASQEGISEPTEEELEAIEPKAINKEPKYYESRIVRAQEKVQKERERRQVSDEDQDVAYEKWMRARTDAKFKTKQCEDLEESISSMKADLKKRRNKWYKFRDYISRTTANKFDEMLSMNKYTGDLQFDHENNSLDLAVQKASEEQGQTKDCKALSGGERSYTTMCLLLALGEKLETPFRILDEFDVFLDPQVRKLTIQALIHVAKRMEHRQFIFITPQDLSGIKPDSQLKIMKMTPPTRHTMAGQSQQTTLNFSQG